MSYDVYLLDSCGEGPDLPGPTYNLTPIFDLALTGEPLPNPDVTEGQIVLFKAKTDRPRGLRLLSGKTGRQSLPMLHEASKRLAMREPFKALEPSNGWGTIDDAIKVIDILLQAASKYPENVWEVH